MKKNYKISIFLMFILSCTFAQPVLHNSDFTNFSAELYYGAPVGISPGNAGANQTWNFSSVLSSLVGTQITIPAGTIPFSGSFPNANFGWKNIYAGTTPSINYSLLKLSSSSLEYVGSTTDTSISTNYSQNSQIVFQFPYTFNTIISDTYQSATMTSATAFITTYDAYGTLVTPYGSYQNVIRQKNVEGAKTTYYWYQASPFRFLMTADFSTNGFIVFYKDTTDLNLQQNDLSQSLQLYPNPAKSVLKIQILNNQAIDKVMISDLSGKKVFEQIGIINQVNIENLAKGMYITEVISGDAKFISKFVKD